MRVLSFFAGVALALAGEDSETCAESQSLLQTRHKTRKAQYEVGSGMRIDTTTKANSDNETESFLLQGLASNDKTERSHPLGATSGLWEPHLDDHTRCERQPTSDVADQMACQQLAVAAGHAFYSFRSSTDRAGLYKCYSSSTCDSPSVRTAYPWRVYMSSGTEEDHPHSYYSGTEEDHPEQDHAAEVDNEWVQLHNEKRALHGACPVVWNADVAAGMQEWVNGLTNLQHDDSYGLAPPQGPAGENLAWSSGQLGAAGSVRMWYDEVNDCLTLPGCEHGTNGAATGHFTAMVWQGVQSIGCAISSNGNFAGCRYWSGDHLSGDTANMGGQYLNNVAASGTAASGCQ